MKSLAPHGIHEHSDFFYVFIRLYGSRFFGVACRQRQVKIYKHIVNHAAAAFLFSRCKFNSVDFSAARKRYIFGIFSEIYIHIGSFAVRIRNYLKTIPKILIVIFVQHTAVRQNKITAVCRYAHYLILARKKPCRNSVISARNKHTKFRNKLACVVFVVLCQPRYGENTRCCKLIAVYIASLRLCRNSTRILQTCLRKLPVIRRFSYLHRYKSLIYNVIYIHVHIRYLNVHNSRFRCSERYIVRLLRIFGKRHSVFCRSARDNIRRFLRHMQNNLYRQLFIRLILRYCAKLPFFVTVTKACAGGFQSYNRLSTVFKLNEISVTISIIYCGSRFKR